jgi:hypothetical protein
MIDKIITCETQTKEIYKFNLTPDSEEVARTEDGSPIFNGRQREITVIYQSSSSHHEITIITKDCFTLTFNQFHEYCIKVNEVLKMIQEG